MKKTKAFMALAILFLILGCTACNRQNVDKPVESPVATVPSVDNSGQHIQRQLDTNLSVDADVIEPSTIQNLSSLLVTPVTWDNKALETFLIANSKVTQKEDYGANGSTFQTADGKQLFSKSGTVNFQTYTFRTYINQIVNAYTIPGDTFYNLDRFNQMRDQDLPFMPQQQAVDEVEKELTSLGISVYDKVDTYALDYQTLQAQEKILEQKGDLTSPKDGTTTLKPSWSQEDDCYYMIIRSGFDNIPVYPLDHGSVETNTIVPSTYIYACYSKKGLEYLSIVDPYKEKAVDHGGLKIISPEEALAAVKRKYANVILTDPTTITAIELNYVRMLINQSRDEFRMVPAWCFELKEVRKDSEKGEPYTVDSRMIIDATTGGEIL